MLACLLALATSGLLVAGGCRDTLDPFDRLPPGPGGRLVTVTDTLFADADTYIRQTQPNANWGAATALQLGGGGKSRVLVRFDSTALRTVVGAGTLDSAWLEFTIEAGPSGWGSNERTVDLHRLLKDWTELGATWNCAVDANTSNSVPDCPTQGWDMTNNGNGTYAPAKTDRLKVNNGQTGVIRLDVTADVQGYLGGTLLHQGWVFRKTSENQGGEAIIFSRESGSQPRLVVRVSTADAGLPPVPPGMNLPTDSTFTLLYSQVNGERYYRNIVGVVFDDTTSGMKVIQVFQLFGATVTGGIPNEGPHGAYIITIPDPGQTSAALDSIRNAIVGTGGVKYVFPISYRGGFDPRGRYPTDGQGSQRTDWFATPPGPLSAWRTVRAPLAWGCETGLYGSPSVTIGVVDFNYDGAHPDLTGSATVVIPRPTDSTSTNSALTDPTIDPASGATVGAIYRSHGTAVAGIIAARGDNGTGIAGMVWNANLSLFAYGRGTTDAVIDPIGYWTNTVIDSAIKLGVRVLTTSNPPQGDTTAATRLEGALARFLQASSKNIFVLPTPNANIVLSVSQLASGTVYAQTTPLDRAAARLSAQFPGQIIFVAGTDGAGGFRFGGAVWTGAAQVAAPAVGVKTLARVSDFTTGTAVRSGNSYAGPFVAGLAAALVSMDSSLTGGEVVSYITRGDTVPRYDSLTGQVKTPSSLSGGPAGFYELDAYGALSLLSQERVGTPICGYDVRFVDSAVVLDRPGGTPSVYPMPAPYHLGNGSVSVAQGGRRIAVSSSIYDTYSLNGPGVTVINHQGTVIQTLANVHRRMYLERDTADIRLVDPQNPVWGNARPLLDLTGPGRGPGDLNQGILNPFVSGDVFYAGWIMVSPTGEYAAAPTVDHVLTSCPAGGSGVFTSTHLHMIPLNGSTPVSWHWQPEDTCAPIYVDSYAGNEQAAFSHDGRSLVFGVAFLDSDPNAQGNDVIRTRLYRHDLGVGTAPPVVVPGWYVQGPRFEADDNVLLAYDFDGLFPTAPPGGPCQAVSRRATSLGTTIGTPQSLPISTCYPLDHGTIIRGNLIASRPPGLRNGWSQPIRRTTTLPGSTPRH